VHGCSPRAKMFLAVMPQTHLDRMAGGRLMFCFMVLVLSYRPWRGLAAARMDVRAFKVAYTAAQHSTHHISTLQTYRSCLSLNLQLRTAAPAS